jgi:hypothetical protein
MQQKGYFLNIINYKNKQEGAELQKRQRITLSILNMALFTYGIIRNSTRF